MLGAKFLMLAAASGSGFLLIGQQPPVPATFTAAQAEAGRAASEKTCSQCHTPALLGRKGDADELPAVTSLSEYYQKFIGPKGFVPPLAGPVFLSRWGSATGARLIARFEETADSFKVDGWDKETAVNITAYILQVNGAKAGMRPLTRSSATLVNSMTQVTQVNSQTDARQNR